MCWQGGRKKVGACVCRVDTSMLSIHFRALNVIARMSLVWVGTGGAERRGEGARVQWKDGMVHVHGRPRAQVTTCGCAVFDTFTTQHYSSSTNLARDMFIAAHRRAERSAAIVEAC
jgi:hypothetical protein